jgi:hypothetical protein
MLPMKYQRLYKVAYDCCKHRPMEKEQKSVNTKHL